MAWTDSCKISATETINSIVEKEGVTKKEAIRKVAKEAAIPIKTLDRWYYPKKANPKTEVNNSVEKGEKDKADPVTRVMKTVENKIEKADKKGLEGIKAELTRLTELLDKKLKELS